MSSGQTYRDRGGGGGGDRDSSYRGSYNNRGGNFRGRGGSGYKPRRYWDSDDFYKDERDHGGRGRRRRSYSRSRSRSRSRSYSRSRSRTPPPRRARSRSPPRQPTEEYVPRPTEHAVPNPYEPYVPTKDPADTWTGSRLSVSQEYVPQANGQTAAALSQMNPYGNVESMYPPQYSEPPASLSLNNQAPPGYGYGHSQIPVAQYHQQPASDAGYSQHVNVSQMGAVAPPPPAISTSKPDKDEPSDTSKKKKDKRKKKKRHHSSSSSSSSSDDSSSESRKRRKSKKGRGTGGSSDSSSEDDKKDGGASKLTDQQKEALLKQRESYQIKLDILEREIKKLQNKQDELGRIRAERQLIDENLKLQAELKGRCKAVVIVLEKIDDVLNVRKSSTEKSKPPTAQPIVPPPPTLAPAIPPSQPDRKAFNDVDKKSGLTPLDFFDNGQHWCRLCNVFPATIQEMLAHFHSKEHHDQIQQVGIDEKPWHKRNSLIDSKPIPGAKKAPFRGMQFFSPVEGWYCRLCNDWMGDPHCAVEHLKNDVHNSNYRGENGKTCSFIGSDDENNRQAYNFLEEHPDWEHKWVNDREKALCSSGKQDTVVSSGKKSRFDDPHPIPIPMVQERKSNVSDDVESGKSIRVQMRNSLKSEEKEEVPRFTASLSEAPVNKDSGLEEWMNKPKVALDIDTQKFAAIVRQKHGAKEKDIREIKSNDSPNVKPTPPPAPPSSLRDRDLKKDDRRRPDKVELQLSSRDRDRDRYRERDSRNSRRRSRSRSRSRSRERRYGGGRRRSRTRSRSRSRDRNDRDRRERVERERPEVKEAVKKLPMIGKMPLYKRPALNKEKSEVEEKKATAPNVPPVIIPAARFLQKESLRREETHTSVYSNNTMSNSGFAYGTQPSYSEGYGLSGSIPSTGYPEASIDDEVVAEQSQSSSFHHLEVNEDHPTVEVKTVDKEGAPTALPDDFQQALDIIYSVGPTNPPGPVPQPVPPPAVEDSANGISDEPPAPGNTSADYEYGSVGSNGYPNYLGYQPYQQSFDGYAPVGYEELDDGPPGVGDGSSSAGAIRAAPPPASAGELQKDKPDVVERDPPPPGDDDMDDLRMLGIDVDDTAVVVKRNDGK
ncbi:unnamed protein product [Orchesella dallaii]|uniref:U1-type domain-containing protein n=1 Tax=Orchesella dallaii TaxID=48710 RepID=A0ABP1QS86_9HEXA